MAIGGTYWRMQVRRENDPVVRAEQMLVARAPLAALAELDKLSDSPRSKSAQVQVVRGKAEHALGQLGMAFADFAAALDADSSVADPHVIRALVDDLESEAFPLQWRPALVRILGERVGSPAAEPLRGIVRSPRSRARREALEALELMGQATDDDRLAVATAELSDKTAGCPAVLNAIRILVVAGTERAHALLARTAAENRRCGSREASDALRRLDRAKGQPAGAPQSGAPPTNHSGPAAAAAMPSATSVVPSPSAAHPVKKISKTKTKKKHRRKPSQSAALAK